MKFISFKSPGHSFTGVLAYSTEDGDIITQICQDLTYFMNENRMTLNTGQVQCLKCAFTTPTIYKFKRHIISHIREDEDLSSKMDEIIRTYALFGNKANTYTCKLCGKELRCQRSREVLMHFIGVHLLNSEDE